jgi:hypothetical protein
MYVNSDMHQRRRRFVFRGRRHHHDSDSDSDNKRSAHQAHFYDWTDDDKQQSRSCDNFYCSCWRKKKRLQQHEDLSSCCEPFLWLRRRGLSRRLRARALLLLALFVLSIVAAAAYVVWYTFTYDDGFSLATDPATTRLALKVLVDNSTELTPCQTAHNNTSQAFQSAVKWLMLANNKIAPPASFSFVGQCTAYLDTGATSARTTFYQTTPNITNDDDNNNNNNKLYIGILSKPSNYAKRNWTRTYWANPEALDKHRVTVRFIVGLQKYAVVKNETTPPRPHYPFSLLAEAKQHGDMILMDALDGHYKTSLPRKTFGLLAWAAAANVQLFKTDDDTYVNLTKLTITLAQFRRLDYAGAVAYHAKVNRKGRFAVSPLALPLEFYPPYAGGRGYTLSPRAARFALSRIQQQQQQYTVTDSSSTANNNSTSTIHYDKIGIEDGLVGLILSQHERNIFRPVDLYGIRSACKEVKMAPWTSLWESFRRRIRSGQWNPWRFPNGIVETNLKTDEDFAAAVKNQSGCFF